MKERLFLIHWNAAEAEEYAHRLRSEGWNVEYETEEGAQAIRRIRENPPDAVIISLSRLPSHGRETADGLRAYKATRDIPIVFVDGREEAVEKTKAKVPDALYTVSDQLSQVLGQLKQKLVNSNRKKNQG